jgi:tetratricopeptide (TPR) repeat protein
MNELVQYIKHPTSDDAIFNLGLYYESIKQYSAAASFYLKCAELTTYNNFRYECLLRLYLCLDQLKDRDHTCEHILKQAISLCPDYSIAYFFLTQIYERKQDWSSVYLFSCIGLQKKENLHPTSKFDYSYCYLYFQKAAASWWLGKADESRSTYRHILNCYFDSLTEPYVKLLESNLCSLGSGPPELCMHTYVKQNENKITYKFPGLEKIERNFSQVYQDMFVLTMLEGKTNGTYLEIGAGEPFYGSNSALLEKDFNWTGVGIELDPNRSSQHSVRKNLVFCVDGTTANYEQILSEHFSDNVIDYLQLDIEPSSNTFKALQKIPFDKYKFRVITYEHDHYIDITKEYREKSRKFLSSLGYILLVNDVSPREDCSFEDWWVHPELVDKEIINKFSHFSQNIINFPFIFMIGK